MQTFLYKALGTVLGACSKVLHIQEKLLQHLEEATAEEPSEAQMELDIRRAHATRSALILAHGSLALHASKEQLLACLEGDMVGSILLLYSCSCRPLALRTVQRVFFSLGPQDLQNTLALLQSIADFSSAFHAVGDSACFNPSLKGKLLEILTVVLALQQLSKLKPSLGTKDMCDMLSLCCKNVVLHLSAQTMLKIRKSQQAAQYLQ
ncbi:hypothetical protein CIB84_016240, partial [Bambusicola thoracicus]